MPIKGSGLALALLAAAGFCLNAFCEEGLGERLDALKARLDKEPELKEECSKILARADSVLEKAPVRRVASLAEFSKLDGVWGRKAEPHKRTEMMENKDGAEKFGLASADVSNARTLFNELPFLAAAYRLAGKKAVLERLETQLEECAAWDPLQRPGWTLTVSRQQPKDGGDGVWLATGCMIQTLVLTMDILPKGSLKPELEAKLSALLEREMKRIAKDWKDKRPWYVKSQKVNSNQWIVPASGLLLSSLALGKDKHPEEYALATDCLARSLDSMGSEGAASEGLAYGLDWSIPALLVCSHYMQMAGDERFAKHPFIAKAPFWVVESYQPGRNFINAFDWWGGCRNMYDGMLPKSCLIAAMTGDPGLLWVVDYVHGKVSRDAFGLIVLGIPKPAKSAEPPRWASFKASSRVNWRSSWSDDADGFWMRGSDENDFHSHCDPGHVNYIKNGKAVLLEAGTGGYSDPLLFKEYQSVRGHNTLQLGESLKSERGANAPFSVAKLDASGGDVALDAGKCHPGLESWTRRASWSSEGLKVVDELVQKDGAKESVLFRWHLGTEKPASVERKGEAWLLKVPAGRIEFPGWIGERENLDFEIPEKDVVETPEIEIEIKADKPLEVTQAPYIDHTFKFRERYHKHTTIEVKICGESSVRCESSFKAK